MIKAYHKMAKRKTNVATHPHDPVQPKLVDVETVIRPLKHVPRKDLDEEFARMDLSNYVALRPSKFNPPGKLVPSKLVAVVDELVLRKGFAYAVALWGEDVKREPELAPGEVFDKAGVEKKSWHLHDFKKDLFKKLMSEKGFAGKYPVLAMGVGNYATPEEYAIMPKEKKEESKTEQKAAKAQSKRETSDVELNAFESKADGTLGKPMTFTLRKGSVLHEIFNAWALKAGSTKAEIVERLVAAFPDREGDKMASTVSTQINRMPKENGFHLGRDDKGRYGIHIEGRSSARQLSPETVEKAEARAAERAEAAAKKTAERDAAKAEKAKEKAEALAKEAATKAKAAEKLAEEKAAEAKKIALAAAKAAKA